MNGKYLYKNIPTRYIHPSWTKIHTVIIHIASWNMVTMTRSCVAQGTYWACAPLIKIGSTIATLAGSLKLFLGLSCLSPSHWFQICNRVS